VSDREHGDFESDVKRQMYAVRVHVEAERRLKASVSAPEPADCDVLRTIQRLLYERGGACAAWIATELGADKAAVNRALHRLQHQRLIEPWSRPEGARAPAGMRFVMLRQAAFGVLATCAGNAAPRGPEPESPPAD
jgi:hypothetical protein